jgi:hypothetical protein
MGVSEILTVEVARGTALISLSMDTAMMRRLHGQHFNKQFREDRGTDRGNKSSVADYMPKIPEKHMLSS